MFVCFVGAADVAFTLEREQPLFFFKNTGTSFQSQNHRIGYLKAQQKR